LLIETNRADLIHQESYYTRGGSRLCPVLAEHMPCWPAVVKAEDPKGRYSCRYYFVRLVPSTQYTPPTRLNCLVELYSTYSVFSFSTKSVGCHRELVTNSIHTARRQRESRGVYWALAFISKSLRRPICFSISFTATAIMRVLNLIHLVCRVRL